jgi:tripartite-type tricarboxylate transporter receptor subunit TctC
MLPMVRLIAGGALALAAFSMPAAAQYPNKVITVVVPFAAGGPTDVVTRMMGEHISRTLGQQLVVENVAGAGGTTGMTRVAEATPDGYTIGVGNTGTQTGAPALYPNLKYDPAKSFAQIGVLNFTPQVIVSKKDIPAKDLKEFVAYLKANQAKLTYAHAGVGSTSHVSGVLFNALFDLKPGMVAYRGTGPVLNDLVAGQVDYTVDQALNVIPQIQAGTVKAYAVAAAERVASIPDVPTTKEAGVDFIFRTWNAMVAPKDTPKEIVAKLADAVAKAHADPKIKERFVELGSTVPQGAERGPEGLEKLVESEVARLTPPLKAALAAAPKQ